MNTFKYSIYLESLGCPKNLVDSEQFLGLLDKEKENFEITTIPEQAHVIIVNTCAFIESAKQEAIDTILELSTYKEIGMCKCLIVAGCLAQRYKHEILEEMDEVDGVAGVNSIGDINEIVERCLSGEKLIWLPEPDNDSCCYPRVQLTPRYTSYLKIAEGCSSRCTYCAIPSIRGPYRSFPMEVLVENAQKLAQQGVTELCIVAQDTTRYGIDLYGEYKIVELLRKIAEISGLKWIRLLYTYPELITDDLLDFIYNSPKMCQYLDIPIQHISTKILKRMGRRSSGAFLRELFGKIRDKYPNICTRTSLIVGFPSENEEDFAELCKFVETGVIDRVGIFKYSQEEGTAAAVLGEQIDEGVKQERYDILTRVQEEASFNNNQRFVRKEALVLIEDIQEDGTYLGRTQYDAPLVDNAVIVDSERELRVGEYVMVDIVHAESFDLHGKLQILTEKM